MRMCRSWRLCVAVGLVCGTLGAERCCGQADYLLHRVAYEDGRIPTAFQMPVAVVDTSGPKPGLIFSCSQDVSLDMGELMKRCAPIIGARGGGGKDFAQGGGGDATRLDEALDEAERVIREALE